MITKADSYLRELDELDKDETDDGGPCIAKKKRKRAAKTGGGK
jgi:hypothetical protein